MGLYAAATIWTTADYLGNTQVQPADKKLSLRALALAVLQEIDLHPTTPFRLLSSCVQLISACGLPMRVATMNVDLPTS